MHIEQIIARADLISGKLDMIADKLDQITYNIAQTNVVITKLNQLFFDIRGHKKSPIPASIPCGALSPEGNA
jgi:hypothetical protein